MRAERICDEGIFESRFRNQRLVDGCEPGAAGQLALVDLGEMGVFTRSELGELGFRFAVGGGRRIDQRRLVAERASSRRSGVTGRAGQIAKLPDLAGLNGHQTRLAQLGGQLAGRLAELALEPRTAQSRHAQAGKEQEHGEHHEELNECHAAAGEHGEPPRVRHSLAAASGDRVVVQV